MKAITTRFYGPSNSRGSRILARDSDNNRVWVSADHASRDPHRDAVVALCRKMGWTGKLIVGGLEPGVNVWVWLPLDLMLAHKGRTCSDVVDLSMTDDQIAEYGRIA